MHNFAIIIINLSFLWYSKNFQLKIYLRLSFLARNLSQNHMRLLVKYKKKLTFFLKLFYVPYMVNAPIVGQVFNSRLPL
jgi:hypothetical protein